jgi:hypothetical protein
MRKPVTPKQRKNTSSARGTKATAKSRKRKSPNTAASLSTSPTPRETSKLADMIALLRRKEGATLDQMMKTTDWQAHSVRGAMSGALKKKRGLTITSIKDAGTRTYRIAEAD